MGRWSYLDTDAERLPEGMTRVGYDADTQVYRYLDTTDGSYWEGAPGCRYGKLFRVRDTATPLESVVIEDRVQGEEPDPELNEGIWERQNASEVPRRQDSLVQKIITRWNSIRRLSRSSSMTSATVVDENDTAAKPSLDSKTEKHGEQSPPPKTPTLVQSPTMIDSPTLEKDDGAALSKTSSGETSSLKCAE